MSNNPKRLDIFEPPYFVMVGDVLHTVKHGVMRCTAAPPPADAPEIEYGTSLVAFRYKKTGVPVDRSIFKGDLSGCCPHCKRVAILEWTR